MLPYFAGQLGNLIGQSWISFSEHITDEFKIVLILGQHFIGLDLLFRKPFDYPVVKSSSSTIFADRKSALFGLDFQQLLFINRTSKLYKFLFHFRFIKTLLIEVPLAKSHVVNSITISYPFATQREQKQDLS